MGNICFCNKNYLTQDELNKENELDNKAYRELQKKIFENNNIYSSNSSINDVYDSNTDSDCACCNNNLKTTVEFNDSIEIIHPLHYNELFNDNKDIDNEQIKNLNESNITQSSNGSNSYIFANLEDYISDTSISIKKNN